MRARGAWRDDGAMRRVFGLVIWALAASCGFAGGPAGYLSAQQATSLGVVEQAALSRAAGDLRCGYLDVTMTEIGAGAWRATGCGSMVTYVCTTRSVRSECRRRPGFVPTVECEELAADAQILCTRDSAIEPHSVPLRVTPRMRDELSGCNDVATERVANVQFGADGRFARLSIDAPAGVRTCLERMLTATRIVAADQSRTFAVRVPASRAVGVTAAAGGAPQAAAGAAPQATAGRAADQVRALVDRHARGIVACVGSGPVAVQVEHDASGALSVSLRGAQRGSVEEECVRALLGRERVAPGAPAGTVLHVAQ